MGLDEVNKEVFAELIARVAGQQPSIAYGFNSKGVAIDPETGDILPHPTGHGLTCATFIAAALRAHGYELVDVESWPERDEDEAFQSQIVDLLLSAASEEHAQAVQKDIGAKRLRPDEIVGAGTIPDDEWAVMFPAARQKANEILQDLSL